MTDNRKNIAFLSLLQIIVILLFLSNFFTACSKEDSSDKLQFKISIVNAPNDIVTQGAFYLAEEMSKESKGDVNPTVYHSGMLSGGNGIAEIEMCQQGSIEMHITTTAYLANLVPRTSIVSLPFLFRDIDQVIRFVKSKSAVLETINRELNKKNLHIIAWWPRGFRQLTNSKRPVKVLNDLKGLKLRVMNNPLYVDIMNAMGAHPVPMEWSEVYTALQLETIDGQENAEDVIYAAKLYETQQYMTVWDYSTDIEIVMVNFNWWNNLLPVQHHIIQQVADASIDYEVALLKKNTEDLRKLIADSGIDIYYMPDENKNAFKEAVKEVRAKYESTFTKSLLDSLQQEIQQNSN